MKVRNINLMFALILSFFVFSIYSLSELEEFAIRNYQSCPKAFHRSLDYMAWVLDVSDYSLLTKDYFRASFYSLMADVKRGFGDTAIRQIIVDHSQTFLHELTEQDIYYPPHIILRYAQTILTVEILEDFSDLYIAFKRRDYKKITTIFATKLLCLKVPEPILNAYYEKFQFVYDGSDAFRYFAIKYVLGNMTYDPSNAVYLAMCMSRTELDQFYHEIPNAITSKKLRQKCQFRLDADIDPDAMPKDSSSVRKIRKRVKSSLIKRK